MQSRHFSYLCRQDNLRNSKRMNSTKVWLLGVFLAFSVGATSADSSADFEETLSRARTGDVDAQFELGGMYLDGEGIAQDYKRAAVWYRKAAEQGGEKAKNRLNPPKLFDVKKWSDGFAKTKKESIGGGRLYGQISFSQAGKKQVFFHTPVSCEKAKFADRPQQHIWVFNEQPVNMLVSCYDSFPGLSGTPKSDRGRRFVVDLFKKSSKDVMVDFNDGQYPLSATGFSKQWSKTQDSVL